VSEFVAFLRKLEGTMRASREPHSERQRSIAWMKLALATVGIITWVYGVREDDHRIRWLGIAFLACAFLLRFLFRRSRSAGEEEEANETLSDG
jgi:hypothetical protein